MIRLVSFAQEVIDEIAIEITQSFSLLNDLNLLGLTELINSHNLRLFNIALAQARKNKNIPVTAS